MKKIHTEISVDVTLGNEKEIDGSSQKKIWFKDIKALEMEISLKMGERRMSEKDQNKSTTMQSFNTKHLSFGMERSVDTFETNGLEIK